MSNLVEHAERELKIVGYHRDSTDPLDRDIYLATLDIVGRFTDCGHSGYSAMAHTQMIERLLRFEPLSPITDHPDEWMKLEDMGFEKGTWQNCRDGRMFSEDGGKTYYSVDELRTGWKRRLFGRRGKTYTSKPSGSY